ncbi:Beta-glucosidase 11-like protein [Drosera capensis]
MRSIVGSRLPRFTVEQSNMLKHAYDYIGLNYYTASYAADDNSTTSITELSYTTDNHVDVTKEKDGVPIGEPTALSWLYIYPEGIQYTTKYVKDMYNDPPIIITENGVAELNNLTLPLNEALQDYQRIRYHTLHLIALLKAIRNGIRVQGYIVWSILDDFEWNFGYTCRFGLNYIDYQNGLKRYPKYSALWFKTFLQKENTSYRLGYSSI